MAGSAAACQLEYVCELWCHHLHDHLRRHVVILQETEVNQQRRPFDFDNREKGLVKPFVSLSTLNGEHSFCFNSHPNSQPADRGSR